MATSEISESQVREAVEALGLDLQSEEFDFLQLWHGVGVEMEHGPRAGRLDLTLNDPLAPAKIAVVHLRLCPDYYERLSEMREGAALADAARALAEESGTGMVHHRPPCRAVTTPH